MIIFDKMLNSFNFPRYSPLPPDTAGAKNRHRAAHCVQKMDPALPPNWRSARAADGKEYYFNELTGETSWTVMLLPPL
jgi:hypothetical protein